MEYTGDADFFRTIQDAYRGDFAGYMPERWDFPGAPFFFVKRTLMNLKLFLIASDFLCCYNNNHEKDGRQMHEREKAVGL